jgi:iron complex outermembrane receptor protein
MVRASLLNGLGSDANRRKVRDSRHREIILLIAVLFAIRSIAFAQESSSPPSGTTPVDANGNAISETERVIVTGSNIPTAEEVGPNPVDTYRREDITRLGARTPSELIQRIPAGTGFGINENNDTTTRVDLRGIGPKDTLVLQDGRRLANEALSGQSLDFNQFPFGLVDHIDILKDGASPLYGTDAVTGVVNVFLIHRFRGLEVYASYGNTNLGFANDMGQETEYLLAGTGDDKTNIVVYAEAFNQAGIFGRDINIAHDADYTQWGGQDLRNPFFPGHVGPFLYQPSLNAGSKTPTPHAYPNAASDPQYVPILSVPRERQLYNFSANTAAIAPADREYLYGSFEGDLCDKYLTVFADFKYFRQFWDDARPPSPFVPDVWTDATHPFGISGFTLSVPTQNAFNPFTVADYTSPGGFNAAFPNTRASAAPPGTAFTTGVFYQGLEAPQTDKITTNNYLFTGGLRGNLAEFANAWDILKTWQWETGIRWNEDHRVEQIGGVVNNNALRTALLGTDPATAFNPFGLNHNNKFVRDQVYATSSQVGSVTLLTEDFALNGDLFNLPGGPFSFAAGTVHLSNTISGNPDALSASGQITAGVAPGGFIRGNRDSWSVYWELRVPITGPTWNFPGAHSLEFDYAERFEDYSDFGTTERPKFALRWQPLGGSPAPLTLRAAYIEAFRAPTLSDLFNPPFQFFGFIFDPVLNRPYQTQVEFSGNPNLQPEFAYERTFGGVLTPAAWSNALQGLTISVDYGRLDIRGFQFPLNPNFIVEHASEFRGLGLVVRDPSQGNKIILVRSPEQNVGRFIESYIDYEAAETLETARLGHGDSGRFTATFNGTYLADVDLQLFPGTKRFTTVGKFGGGFGGPARGGNFTHNRWYASLFYDGSAGSWLQGIDAGVIVHYIGQYWDNVDFTFFNNKPRNPAAPPADQIPIGTSDRKVREWTTLDLIINYTFNLPPPAAQIDVAGYAKDGAKRVKMNDGKEKRVMPLSTAEYNPCGWRAWLNNTTMTLGMNNVFDSEPPFVAAAPINGTFGPTIGGFDQDTTNAKGRFWYVALKKTF